MRGGPAKAAVVASGLSGIYSTIANVVSTGTFTIPLMKKTGLTPEKAGAVEVAASTNGQLTPYSAAFLIAEFRHRSGMITHAALHRFLHRRAEEVTSVWIEKSSRALPFAQKLGGVIVGILNRQESTHLPSAGVKVPDRNRHCVICNYLFDTTGENLDSNLLADAIRDIR